MSNYARMFAGLLIGILVTRMLLAGGPHLFGLYTTITIGFGVSVMLFETLRYGIVATLGPFVSQGKVIDSRGFRLRLNAALLTSLSTAVLGGLAMLLLGVALLPDNMPPSLERAAWMFLLSRIAMMLVVVTMTPAMALLQVAGRQVAFNGFTFLERLSEFFGVLIPMYILSDMTGDEASGLIWIGLFVSAFTVATYCLAALTVFAMGPDFRPVRDWPNTDHIHEILDRVGWSSLETISMNLYARSDILIVAAFLGPVGTVALGIAIRLMGYVRQATVGLVNGLDASFANLHGQKRRRMDIGAAQGDDALWLVSVSTALQGSVVFQLGVLLLLFREDIVHLWIGDLLTQAASSLTEIATLSSLMIIGIGFRSLNLGWMTAMTGSGNARRFTPWLLPGALANVTVLLGWAWFLPETFSVIVVGWAFLGFQAVTHVVIIPILAARFFECGLVALVRPLFWPFGLALFTFGIALALRIGLADRPLDWSPVGAVAVVALGFAASVYLTLRKRPA